MPLNLSFTHILVVLVVALIVLGPQRLPEAARTAGKWIAEFRRLSSGLEAEVRDVFGELTDPLSEALGTLRDPMGRMTSAVTRAMDGDGDEAPTASPGGDVALDGVGRAGPAEPRVMSGGAPRRPRSAPAGLGHNGRPDQPLVVATVVALAPDSVHFSPGPLLPLVIPLSPEPPRAGTFASADGLLP